MSRPDDVDPLAEAVLDPLDDPPWVDDPDPDPWYVWTPPAPPLVDPEAHYAALLTLLRDRDARSATMRGWTVAQLLTHRAAAPQREKAHRAWLARKRAARRKAAGGAP